MIVIFLMSLLIKAATKKLIIGLLVASMVSFPFAHYIQKDEV